MIEAIQPSESQTKLRVNVDGAFGTEDGLSLYSKKVGVCEMLVGAPQSGGLKGECGL